MLINHLKGIEVILASQSPRRKELLNSMDIDFSIEVKSIDESITDEITSDKAAEFIAAKKLSAFEDEVYYDKLVITADTVVVDADNNILGKPHNAEEAMEVLASLSGKSHIVYTGVAYKYLGKIESFTCKTDVLFCELSAEEIAYYVNKYIPLDKAGSYGIQEWIGRVGVDSIVGSFENVMGLPTSKLYHKLIEFLSK